MPTQHLGPNPCQHCGVGRGITHYGFCVVNRLPDPPSQDARHAIDTIKKWSVAMGKRWNLLHQKMVAVGISQSKLLSLGRPKTICTLSAEHECVQVEKEKQELGFVLENPDHCPDFDIALLPEIRTLVSGAFKEYEAKIQAVLDERARKLRERHDRINKMLPSIADEFGADIMQYGEPGPKKPKPKDEDIPF